jgi:hypothetical protein
MSDSYYRLNREKRKEYQHSYYEKNKEVIAKRRRLEQELLPKKSEKRDQYQQEYYQKNKIRISEQRHAAYLKKNPDARKRKKEGN